MTKPFSEAYPKSFDLIEWLTFGLGLEDEEIRLFCLYEIQRDKILSDVLPLVEKVRDGDPSEKCRETAAEIIFQHESWKSGIKLSGSHELTPQGIKSLLEGATLDFTQGIINSMKQPLSEELLELWRAQLVGESSPVMQALGLSLLARFGKPSDATFALPLLDSPKRSVVKAAIDLLHEQNPELFQSQSDTIFSISDLDIRIHGLRKLGTFNEAGAFLHLKELLFSDDPFIRQRALPEIILLPFEITQNVLIQYLGKEEHPILLAIAGVVFCLNPHPTIPEKIYEIFLRSGDIKAHILQLILNTLLASIRAIGILKEPDDVYLGNLKSLFRKKQIAFRINSALADISGEDSDVRREAVQELRSHFSFPNVREALENRFSIETDPGVKDLLRIAIGKPEEKISFQKLEREILGNTFSKLPAKAQKELLSSVSNEQEFDRIKHPLVNLPIIKMERSFICELFWVFEKFGKLADSSLLIPFLKAQDPVILSGAIKALGSRQPKRVSFNKPGFPGASRFSGSEASSGNLSGV